MEATASTRAELTKDQTTFFFTDAKQIEVTKETLTVWVTKGSRKWKTLRSSARTARSRLQRTSST
eukprot:13945832-Ditylum_brightwellii.AAC.1